MNRNLKRVLSLALTLAVVAVNFVIPAYAADISVAYSDLPTDLLGTGVGYLQQGTLFYDTTPGTATGHGVDTITQMDDTYAPLDVWSATARAALNMKGGEWARYEVNATTAGFYSVDLTYGCATAADFIIRTDSSIIETRVTRSGTNAHSPATLEDVGYVYLAEGANYIYVDNKSTAQVNFRRLDLTLDTSADATMVDWIAPIASANEIADLTVVYNDGYNQAAVSTVTFPVEIMAEGKYKVSVMGKAGAENTVAADFGSDAKTATVSNDAYGYSEIGVFPLMEGEYTLTLNGFTDYSLAWAKVEYVSPYLTTVESESFSDGNTIARGTDNLTITFNDTMMDTATATLTADGTELPVDVSVDGANVIVSFLETLAYETEYTLTVTGLQGANDAEALEDRSYTVTTGTEDDDAATDAVTVTEVTSYREAITIEGVVAGSTGCGIKGRTVTVTDPDGVDVITVTSGDNGAFTAEFTIADGTDAGAYNYTVTAEYGATETAVVSYVSEAEELRIIGEFEDATTPEAVYAIFETYGEILLVPNYAADCAGLADDDLFLAHFAGKDFNAVSEVAPFYNKMLKMEGLNQATTGSYIKSNYLNNAEVCELIGIASDKLALVNTDSKKTSFSDDIAQYNRDNGKLGTSEETILARFEALLDAWILEENNIQATALDLTGATASCYYAGEIAIPLNFTVAQTKVKTVEVTVTTAQAALLENAAAVVEGATTDVVISGNTATFTIDFEYDAIATYDDLGKISLQASVIATHNIDVAANVIYVFDTGLVDEEHNAIYAELPISVAGGTVTAIVYPTPVGNIERPVTDGGTTGGGYVAPPKEKPVEEDDSQASGYFFDDMGDAIWAQDMVHALVGKGIISKNDERAFRPMDNVTREEYVKMLVTVVGSHKADAKSNLVDVDGNHWASSYIATAQELGIVKGNADGTFGLGQKITRQDMAVMLYRTFQLLGIELPEGTNAFTDSSDIADYAKVAVSALEKQGIINGMGDGTFAPANNATRAQSAKVIYSMMEVLGV